MKFFVLFRTKMLHTILYYLSYICINKFLFLLNPLYQYCYISWTIRNKSKCAPVLAVPHPQVRSVFSWNDFLNLVSVWTFYSYLSVCLQFDKYFHIQFHLLVLSSSKEAENVWICVFWSSSWGQLRMCSVFFFDLL